MKYTVEEVNSLLIAVKSDPSDNVSYDRLFELMKTPIYFIAQQYLPDSKFNHYDFEDMIGNTFVRLLEKIDTFTTRKNGPAWILTITANLCKDYRKKRRREIITDKIEIVSKKDSTDDMLNKVYIGDMLKQLTRKERTILYFRVYQEKTDQEIATLLKVSKSTVERHGKKAIKDLQKYKE